MQAFGRGITIARDEMKKNGNPEPDGGGMMEAFGAAVAKMADEFSAAVERLKNEVDANELKTALQAHIDMLEEMYSRI